MEPDFEISIPGNLDVDGKDPLPMHWLLYDPCLAVCSALNQSEPFLSISEGLHPLRSLVISVLKKNRSD